VTLAEAQTLRDIWLAAEKAWPRGRATRSATGQLTRADARFVHQQFMYYDGLVTQLAAGRSGVRVVRAIPVDR
jgi:hypothetical protein